jgi:DNA-binding CsgD family transcriptional regulator
MALARATEPRQPVAVLRAHRLLGKLAAGAGDLEQAEQHLAAALDLATACAAPYERAMTLFELARARATDQTTPLLEEVRSLCMPLGAQPLLDRVHALERRLAAPRQPAPHPAGLTSREVDVLRLLVDGHSDREIAARLSIGSRTVQSHVTSILAKLAVTSRTAAATWAVRNGVV